jgi:molecular chaperone DnaK (HSP70)
MVAIGIDLGTTNSVAAIDDEHGLRILPTRMREALTPSVVTQRRGEWLVGQAARRNITSSPEDTIFSVKRLMGRSFDDPEVAAVRARCPYAIVADDSSPGDRGVRVVVNGVPYTPVQISTKILQQVVADASVALGNKEVTHAVITVPAYFTEPQRAATREAGQKAGLKVKRIIDEPTAAAIAFGIDRSEANQILVFDLGGGTLDVSILQMGGDNQFDCVAAVGDRWLGGDDFDYEIVNIAADWVQKKYGVDALANKRFRMEAKFKAEEVKRMLTAQEDADLFIPAVVPLPSGEMIGVDIRELPRRQFEDRIRPLVNKCIDLVTKVLARECLPPDRIDTVLLVGGATAVPLVQRELARLFGDANIKQTVDPMHAVALGAAVLATRLTGVECPKCGTANSDEAQQCTKCNASLTTARSIGTIELDERTTLSLGIGVLDESGRPDRLSIIIPAGTQYPLAKPLAHTYVARGHKIAIPVYEGENEIASRNEYLGRVDFKLPADMPAKAPVTVEMNYDRDRTLRVRLIAQDGSFNQETSLVRGAAMVTGEGDDQRRRDQLRRAIDKADRLLQEYATFMRDGQRRLLDDERRRGKQALNDRDATVIVHACAALLKAIGETGTAHYLYLIDAAMADVDAIGSEKLAQARDSLRRAYLEDEKPRVEQLQQALDDALTQIWQIQRRTHIEQFGEWLEEVKK